MNSMMGIRIRIRWGMRLHEVAVVVVVVTCPAPSTLGGL
jgi:hypothetical protein